MKILLIILNLRKILKGMITSDDGSTESPRSLKRMIWISSSMEKFQNQREMRLRLLIREAWLRLRESLHIQNTERSV